MKRSYSNGKLKFSTLFQKKEICLFEIDIKEPFEYETEEVDDQIIDTIIKNDKLDTALHLISNDNHFIALQSIVVNDEEATFPVIIFDKKKCTPAIQNDHLILITKSSNLLSDYPLVKECTNEIEWQFLNRLNTCEIHVNPDFHRIEYHNSRPSHIDGLPNYFHFNKNFDEIYANYREEECRVSRWTYNIGQKNECIICQYDDTEESFIYYTNPIERFKHNVTRPKTLAILGALALVTTAIVKCSSSHDTPEPKMIIPAEIPTQDISSLPRTR
ncbi:MAG: hypothetical protein IKV03_02810 [Alphaproteobacteria bacterium]|nr:hypothetical protein [Alphaproteobacteria bacterium]